MALTVTNINPQAEDVWGRHRVRLVSIAFDNSYPTGGESFTPASVGLAQIDAVFFSADHSPAYQFAYDHSAQKILVFGVEQDADAATTEPLDEENNTADLSTVTIRALVIGN